jgi:hypothetical protein
MKLSVALVAGVMGLSEQERASRMQKVRTFKPIRYVYEFPMCQSVEQCVQDDETGRCDGKTIQNKGASTVGEISHRVYDDKFECRWEIIAPQGHHVGLKFFNDFDLEWQPACGFDRLHIRCLDTVRSNGGVPIERMCGPKNLWKNGKRNFPKIIYGDDKNRFFKQSDSTECKHLIIELNTDQDTHGISDRDGFTVGWYFAPGDDKWGYDTVVGAAEGLKAGAKAAARAEYKNWIQRSRSDTSKRGKKFTQRLISMQDDQLAKVDSHVDNYHGKMLATVARCGRGYSRTISQGLASRIRRGSAAHQDPTAGEWYELWNRFATETLTGEGVSCGWYERAETDNPDEALDFSSFPCRTRRMFQRMLGRNRGTDYTCTKGDIDTFDLD